MSLPFSQVPLNASGKPEPFVLRVPDKELSELQTLLRLSKIGPETWWNRQHNLQYGISRDWLIKAKDTWLNSFNWREHEARINSFPNFTMAVDNPEHGSSKVHFLALFSAVPNAIPVIFMHGWPGSIVEFLPMLDLLTKKYTPTTLPYHIVVPSLPGFGLSSEIGFEKEFTMNSAARVLNQLMIDLGFDEGYVAQGGDVGSMLTAIMLREYKECKAAHFNLLSLNFDDMNPNAEGITAEEAERIRSANAWRPTSTAYLLQQGTRPATIGHAIVSSPLSVLSWIGEKLLEWSSEPVPLDHILANVGLYWFTSTFPTSLYVYPFVLNNKNPYETSRVKPIGYSCFPGEIIFLPKAMAEKSLPNLIQYTAPKKGGHFAALEVPELFLKDVEEFVRKLKDAGHV